ncbi:conjugal transfer protein TraD [Sphingorhabdus pulchriflava]|uniref:Conjugal transfer protein TraD n=1 Tax=Sphingorhabdus pulchriflava TaxID=2292257 RepID=A0A371BIL9_9SPHN|nr:type IV secretion system DNA-binding domain-containing protein [Sphingorhabdus pulchriflava]RDV07429.1 conjugal transfer protein TraD [Sphingorhabdus pulchriflava]
MKRNLLNFTRGSQLLGHFGFMFAAGLKGPVIIAAVVIGGLCWWNLSKGLSPHETYLIWMRIYAAIYGFMEFDPAKSIAIETGLGGTVQMPLGVVEDYPPIILAWAHMLALLKQALIRSALALVPAMIAFYWFAARFGSRSKERKHERGALLATLPELTAEIGEHNAREWKRELNEAMGIKWRFALGSELRRLFPYAPSHLAKVSYPWRLEQSHAMLIGTTGMGKTVALSDMIEEARSTGQRAVIFDLTGTFIEHFYESDRDIILNPLDARCPQWSVFDECRDEAEFSAAAEALVPHDGGGSEQFWVLAARLLFVEMCLKLRAKGSDTNEALATELMTADLTQVHKLMRGTIADPLTAPEAARMAESIRAVFNANAKALKLLPKTGPRFSVRDWVESDARDGSMLYISARYIDMSVCSQLLTVWLDTAMNTLMAMERTRDLRLWFFIDEMGALHRLPALEKGLQTARNFGGAIVTGIHAYAKLKEVYGENMAMTLSSLARTKLILGTADRETATWCSDFIGHTQVRDMEEGYTYGYNNARDAVSLTPRKNIEPLLLPDQLMNLPRLSGYLKFPDGFPAAPVKLVPVSRKKRAEPFIRRAGDDGPSNGTPPCQLVDPAAQSNADEHPSSNDDGAGKGVVPSQGELALKPAHIVTENERAMPGDQSRIIEQDVAATSQPSPNLVPNDDRDKPPERPQENRSGTTQPALPMDKVLRVGTPQTEGQEQWSPQGTLPAPRPALLIQKSKTDRDMGKADAARRLMLEDGMRVKDEAKDVVDLGDLDMDL